MKTKLLTFATIGMISALQIDAHAANCYVPGCPGATPASNCYETDRCTSCSGAESSTTNGVITTKILTWDVSGTCPKSGTYSCTCTTTTTYKCAENYYGNPTNSSSGCTACPDGTYSPAGSTKSSDCRTDTSTNLCPPTCPTQQESWVDGADGYQARCLSTSSTSGTCEVRCAPGYFGTAKMSVRGVLSGCELCPTSGGVAGQSAAGATAVTGCYIPSGTAFSDSTGSGTYADNCYWTE